jgi:hypothetical protein
MTHREISREGQLAMADIDVTDQDSKKLRKFIYAGVIVISLLLIAGLVWLKRQPDTNPTNTPAVQPQLEGAIRAGSPEFAKLMEGIKMDEPQATVDQTALGGLSMNLFTTVRNFSGKNITGLEMKGTVIDSQKKPVRERVLIVIPKYQANLENTRAMPVRIRIEGFKDTEDRANIKMEITGLIVN